MPRKKVIKKVKLEDLDYRKFTKEQCLQFMKETRTKYVEESSIPILHDYWNVVNRFRLL